MYCIFSRLIVTALPWCLWLQPLKAFIMFHQYLFSSLTCLSTLLCNPFICLLPKGVIKVVYALLSPFVMQWLKCLFLTFLGECRHAIWVPCPARWADLRQHVWCHRQIWDWTGPPSVSTIKLYACIYVAFCLPLPCRIHGRIPVFPNGLYSLHELFQIELDPFSPQIRFGISNDFTEAMTEGNSMRLECNRLKRHIFQILANQLSVYFWSWNTLLEAYDLFSLNILRHA